MDLLNKINVQKVVSLIQILLIQSTRIARQ